MRLLKFFILQFISISVLILNNYFLGPYIRKPFSTTMLIVSALYIAILAIGMRVFFGLFQRYKDISLLLKIIMVVICIILFVLLIAFPLGKAGFQ